MAISRRHGRRSRLWGLNRLHFVFTTVVLLDMQMPVMDGMETIRRIRAGEAGEAKRDVPVVALTALAMKGDEDMVLAAGCNAYLAKPIDMSRLLATLEGLLLTPVNVRTPEDEGA